MDTEPQDLWCALCGKGARTCDDETETPEIVCRAICRQRQTVDPSPRYFADELQGEVKLSVAVPAC